MVRTGRNMTPKILVVDDDRTTLLLVTGRLIKLGYSVLTASDGEKGLELARLIRPNLVISDMLIPKIDGLTLCRTIKADPELTETRFILITAVFKQGAFRAEASAAGIDEFMEKPLDMDALIAKVAALAGQTDEWPETAG
jgi:CheY-like chemotaxis protein